MSANTVQTMRQVIEALAFLTILLPGLANAHGDVAIEEDPCVRRVGGSLVHFNAYQPQNETKGQYCTDIPGEGETFLVLDLMDPGLRNMPVSVRIVKGFNDTGDDQTVAYWPPAIQTVWLEAKRSWPRGSIHSSSPRKGSALHPIYFEYSNLITRPLPDKRQSP